jgi:hypothetical protein
LRSRQKTELIEIGGSDDMGKGELLKGSDARVAIRDNGWEMFLMKIKSTNKNVTK